MTVPAYWFIVAVFLLLLKWQSRRSIASFPTYVEGEFGHKLNYPPPPPCLYQYIFIHHTTWSSILTHSGNLPLSCVSVPGPCDPEDLIDGIIFAANYLGSTQLLSDKTPSKNVRMMQAQEAVSRIKVSRERLSSLQFWVEKLSDLAWTLILSSLISAKHHNKSLKVQRGEIKKHQFDTLRANEKHRLRTFSI